MKIASFYNKRAELHQAPKRSFLRTISCVSPTYVNCDTR